MDATHLHLFTNHAPILGSLFCFLLLLVGMILKNRTVEIVALTTLILVSIITIPVYLSGEEAEHKVEHMSGVSEWELEEHEEHAETTLWLIEISGVLALMVLLSFQYAPQLTKWSRLLTLILCLVSFLSTIPLGLHGGKIMHSELRDGSIEHAE